MVGGERKKKKSFICSNIYVYREKKDGGGGGGVSMANQYSMGGSLLLSQPFTPCPRLYLFC